MQRPQPNQSPEPTGIAAVIYPQGSSACQVAGLPLAQLWSLGGYTPMPKYIIPQKRVSFIREHFFQWSFDKPDGFQPSKDAFLHLDHSADLHYLAHIYNWDDGSIVLEWLLDSPLCTRSTANLLFWRAAPDWHLRFPIDDLEACPSINRAGFIVLRKIVGKYGTNDFSTFQIEFDPADEIEEIMTKDPKWTFPSGVYNRIAGVEVLYEK